MTTSSGLQWSSRFTFIMAAVGCAVGLGNIWLFPFLVGVNGGGAFVLVYLGAIVLLSLPVLIAELMIGRRGAAGPPEAIATVARESGASPRWGLMGVILGGGGATMALAFYGVAGGWAMSYTWKLASGQLQQADSATTEQVFSTLNSTPGTLVPWVVAFVAITIFISARGVQAGVEKAVKFMMPALFAMLIGMVIYAAIMGDFTKAVSFLFQPDFSKLNSATVLAAFGAAFFSVSVGLTNMTAYGAYVSKRTHIPKTALTVIIADTAVALFAGLAIFPLIFAYGLQPAAGEGLVFISLPIAFGQMPGGQIVGSLFFLLLFFAAITSSIGMLEAPVSWLRDATRLNRHMAAILSGSVGMVLAIFAALSFNVLSDVHPLAWIPTFEGKGFFAAYIHLVLNVMMPIGGILICVFAGWLVKKQFSREELFNGEKTPFYTVWSILVRSITPAILAFVLWDVVTA